MTMPANGSVNGSHGERLSALRFWDDGGLFGPEVAIVRMTCGTPDAPTAIGLALHVTVVSGSPLQAKLMGNVVGPLVGVTVKVAVVVCPESTVAGVVGADRVKVGATTVTVTAEDVDDAFVPV